MTFFNIFLDLLISYYYYFGICYASDNTIDKHANSFLKNIHNVVRDSKDIVFFNGHKVKSEFGKGLCVCPTTKDVKLRTWSDVKRYLEISGGNVKMRNYTSNKAIHIHNEFMPGDFIQLLQRETIKLGLKWIPKTLFNTKNVIELFNIIKLPKPLVITNVVDENWGFLSTPINTRTAKWINMTNHLRIHSANHATLRAIISSNEIVLFMTNGHIDPKLGVHKKILSLPLGVHKRPELFKAMKKYKNTNKTKLLTINNSGWRERSIINKVLIERFATYNITLINSYPGKFNKRFAINNGIKLYKDFYQEIAESAFVLCPSGLSMDSYRLWETLLLGSIPVVESNPGLDRTYSNLPVLVVKNYSDLNPKLLRKSYECFYKNADRYKYNHLTTTYWHQLMHRAVRRGNIDHVTRNHPYRNAYCDYLYDNEINGIIVENDIKKVRPDGRNPIAYNIPNEIIPEPSDEIKSLEGIENDKIVISDEQLDALAIDMRRKRELFR